MSALQGTAAAHLLLILVPEDRMMPLPPALSFLPLFLRTSDNGAAAPRLIILVLIPWDGCQRRCEAPPVPASSSSSSAFPKLAPLYSPILIQHGQ